MAVGHRLSTLADIITDASKRSQIVRRRHSEKYWSLREGVVREYDRLHATYLFHETLTRGLTFTWTSGRTIDLSSTTITLPDASTTTGVQGWRSQPHIVASSGETLPWERQELADIENRYRRYLGGDTDRRYLEGSGSAFVFAVTGDMLVTVAAVTDQTITLDHYRTPAAILETTESTTEPELPREFMHILSAAAARDVILAALATEPASNKESRRAFEQQYKTQEAEVMQIEDRLRKNLELSLDVRHVMEPGFYESMFAAAQERGTFEGSHLTDYDRAMWT